MSRFSHDKAQQASYALVDDSARPALHQLIGQRLLKAIGSEAFENAIFEVVNHLNHGQDLLKSSEERADLARMNLQAGQRAVCGDLAVGILTEYDNADRYGSLRSFVALLECRPKSFGRKRLRLDSRHFASFGDVASFDRERDCECVRSI